MKDVMLDLETFGLNPGCAVRSIGAVIFDPKGGVGRTFYKNICQDSCKDAKLTSDPRTIDWWAQQSAAAQDIFAVDPQKLVNVVTQFAYWFNSNKIERVWAQGANFDPGIWEAACRSIGHAAPWKFWNVRDTRTAYDLFKFNEKSIKREGTYHNALDDAKHQVKCVQTALGSVVEETVNVFA